MSNCCLKTKLLSIQSQESAEILLSNLIQINICVNCLSCLNSKLENEIVVNPTQESAGILPSNLIQVNIEIANYLELSQLSSQHWNCKLSRIVSVVNPTQESAGNLLSNLIKRFDINPSPKKSGSKGVRNCYPFIPKNSNTRTVSDHECTDWL